ncbi:MAG: YhbY family RNA-binding protein [Burkholderiales bacterium]
MKPLTPTERRALRAKAHHLDPVVIVGQHGLTAPVLHEIDVALAKHELLKVRAASEARDDRDAMLARICAELDCAPVQHLGRVLIVWRPNPEKKKKEAAKAALAAAPARKKKSGPRAPVDPVRERRRSTRGAARHLPQDAAPAPAAAPETRARRRRA